MPVPGPRTQRGPRPGYDNPEHRTSQLFNLWDRPPPVMYAGQTPGTKVLCLNGFVLAPGQIRRMWRQKINQILPAPPYNQVTLSPAPGREQGVPAPVDVTRGMRYMASTRNQGSGDNLSHWGGHSIVHRQNVNPTPTVGAGNVRNQPTVRNRLTSFGARVPTLNGVVPGARNRTGE
jgi:hypothetical protein